MHFFDPVIHSEVHFYTVRVPGRCCILGVVMRYKCMYSLFFSSFPVSIISFSDVLYESRKCKIYQTASLLLFCMGAKFNELLLAQGKRMKLSVSQKSGVAEDTCPYESAYGGWRKLHIEECHSL